MGEEPEEEIITENTTCQLTDFEPRICRPEKTAVLFLGSETEDVSGLLESLDDLQGVLNVDILVLDMASAECQGVAEKYKIDKEASQLMVFANCEKKGAVALDGQDCREQAAKLKELLDRE